MSEALYIALIHYPVLNKEGELITTSVTNLDLHDIARTARTYGVAGYFVVTPIEGEQALIETVLGHWKEGAFGGSYNPDRKEALSLISLKNSLAEVVSEIKEREASDPYLVATSARKVSGLDRLDPALLFSRLSELKRPGLVLFGTGHGLAEGVFSESESIFPPIFGPLGEGGYNHLSVRSAVAITLDRISNGRSGSTPL